jgi:flavin reductase (DIM6/NTAB) family NADH-FMN oxidoreductase RutF
MSIDAATFRRVMRSVPTAVSVVTVVDATGRDHGMTVGAFCSLSLEPPLVLICVGDDATLSPVMSEAAAFGVSVLSEGQQDLSVRFADRAERGFEGLAHERAPGGTILLDGTVAAFECRVVARHRGGDHTIVIGEMSFAKALTGAPLIHHQGGYRTLDPRAS